MVEKALVAFQGRFLSIRAPTSTNSAWERAIGGLLTRRRRQVSLCLCFHLYQERNNHLWLNGSLYSDILT